mgnify:CR=1 FL=1
MRRFFWLVEIEPGRIALGAAGDAAELAARMEAQLELTREQLDRIEAKVERS